MIGDSSIVNKPILNDSTWSKLPLWGGSPQSPTSSLKTQYHSASSHSNSKESLWHSTQSSPNSNLREQMQTSNSTNLWESPSSKLSQASLMFNKSDSFNSVWTIPPAESPVNKLASLWDTPSTATSITSSYSLNNTKSTEGFRLIRPQDLCGTEIWSNTNTNNNGNSMNLVTTKTKEPVGSLWASPTPNYNKINSVVGKSSFTMKPILARSSTPIGSSSITSTGTPATFATNSNYNNLASNGGSGAAFTNNTGGTAASSCLQLFSDEFLNYLNMIN